MSAPQDTREAVEAMARAMAAEAGHDNPEFVAPAFRAPAKAALTALCTLHPGVGAILRGEAVAIPTLDRWPRKMNVAFCDAANAWREGGDWRIPDDIMRPVLAATPYAQETPDAE